MYWFLPPKLYYAKYSTALDAIPVGKGAILSPLELVKLLLVIRDVEVHNESLLLKSILVKRLEVKKAVHNHFILDR